MTIVFIAGSIAIKTLAPQVLERIDNVVSSRLSVIVGDADGADTAIQTYLAASGAADVTVYCSGTSARNNVGGWPLRPVETKHRPGSRAFFTAKDVEMARSADFGLMIWDSKSTGTLSNVVELLGRGRKSVVFIEKEKSFLNVGSVDQLEQLVAHMTSSARAAADDKMKLAMRIDELRHRQGRMFEPHP
ncbi:MAG TPA: hypothetical protein VF453_14190 [Burkholderiaceae bacterium]